MELLSQIARERPFIVERDREISIVTDLFDQSSRGHSGIAAIEGTVGSGKTSLLQILSERAKVSGAVVLGASCSRTEQSYEFAVVRQLLQYQDIGHGTDVVRRLDETTLNVMLSNRRSDAAEQVAERVQVDLLTLLRHLAGQRPLVVVVDDVHHMDLASARCLLYAVRRLRSARFVLAVAQSTVAPHAAPFFHDELLRLPHCRAIRLALLSTTGVRRLLAATDPEASDRLAAICHRTTGGNPLLLRALVDDWQDSVQQAGSPTEAPVPGDHFAAAVQRCLHRTSPALMHLARGTAVLGDVRSPVILSRMLGIEPVMVQKTTSILTGIGLLHEGRFRHERARAAVLEEMSPRHQADLHRRAAELLHQDGASIRTLAEHLLAAGTVRAPWAVEVLNEAARGAAADDEVELAERCLELAGWASTNQRQRATTKVTLLDVAWRVDPVAAERQMPSLINAMRQRQLSTEQLLTVVRHLLWHGRIDDAAEALRWLGEAVATEPGAHAVDVRVFYLWLTKSYPPLATMAPPVLRAVADQAGGAGPLDGIDQRVRAAIAFADVLSNKADRFTLPTARQVLQSCSPGNLDFEAIHCALITLLYSDRLHEAADECDRLLADDSQRHAVTWRAILTGIQAEIRLRRGDLPAAERLAHKAMNLLSPQHGGVAAGLPMSCLLVTAPLLGRAETVGHLVQQRVPPALLQSRHGLVYQHARGQYHLATKSPQAALEDFAHCGDLARSWELDMPTLVPWRAGMAEAMIRLGRHDEAREVLQEQLMLTGERYPRAHGMALRLLAGTVRLRERADLLTQAIELLRSCGDQLNLAQTLLDLGMTYGTLGEPRRARMQTQVAHRLAKQCGATTLLPSGYDANRPDPAPETMAVLTHAERRVAVLAARGHTNREIAEQLFVTPSTVEQHLTKVFRKLQVRQREELPAGLGLPAVDPG